MKIEEIEIHADGITRPHRVLGAIKARVGAATVFSKTPTIEDVNFKLREEAMKKGANAVINVKYDRGISATSWKALTATGTAIFAESDEVKCPFCAELIKREAITCRYCGKDLNTTDIPQSITPPRDEPPQSAAPSQDAPPSTDAQQMEEYGITFDGDRYAYGEYKYDMLSDAVSYAKLRNKRSV